MLLLTRKVNEEVVITVPPSTEPQRIRLVIIGLRIKQELIRLGFDADERVTIHRKEIQDIIESERA